MDIHQNITDETSSEQNSIPKREEAFTSNARELDVAAANLDDSDRRGRRSINNCGIVEQTNRQDSTQTYYVDNEDSDENDILLPTDRRGFEVSGHHISDSSNQTSANQTLIHLVKGNLGTGILAMPDAIHNSGLLTGCLLLPFLAMICTHCMHLLVWSSSELQRRTSLRNVDYAKVAEGAFENGPEPLRRLSTAAYYTISFFLVVTQLGFCCVYVVFISANLQSIASHFSNNASEDVHLYILIIALPILMISMINTLKSLYYPSLFSNLAVVAGLTMLFSFLLTDLPNIYDRTQFTSLQSMPLFLATSIYAFEGIGVVLPLHRNMKKPEELGGTNGVLNTAMCLVTCLYFSVGFFGYLKYGDEVLGSITLNLPQTDIMAVAINILFILAIFFTYALMLYVPVELTWPHFVNRFSRISDQSWFIYLYKSILVIFTIGAAAIIPHIALFISLVGAIASSTLALIFPPLIHSIVFYETQSRWGRLKNIFISLFGLMCFVTGTWTSLQEIIKELGKHGN